MEASIDRSPSSERIASSRAASTGVTPRFRHAALQERTSSHDRAHFLRHTMRRPQDAQAFSGIGPLVVWIRDTGMRAATWFAQPRPGIGPELG